MNESPGSSSTTPVGLTFLVNGQDRVDPTNDVAVVDFTGKPMTDADWAKVAEEKHVPWNGNRAGSRHAHRGTHRPVGNSRS